MAEKFSLKDFLFNRDKVEIIAGELKGVFPGFKKEKFVSDVLEKFPELELKARISWISDCLRKYLPSDYVEAVGIICESLPAANDPGLLDDDFGDFIYAPYAEFVARNGCEKKYLKVSLHALYQITQRFSAEDAIRYFINAFPEVTLKELLVWSKDSHYHVRRLCSEGTRPKLPWSQKIGIDVTAPLPILDNLFFDKTRFVTRSVANHINDISKVDAKLAISTLKKWSKMKLQKPAEMDYIIRHALRTLVKQGNPEAMKMLGFSHEAAVKVSEFSVSKLVKMNTELEFSFNLVADESENVLVDYVLHFQNKAGQMKSRKVFKLKKMRLEKGVRVEVRKKHRLMEKMTTRTVYRGRHLVEIQVNGKILASEGFEVI